VDELTGTKELIFDAFVEMTSTFGYESVSMRDIAKKVGIKVASIYNHFESKQKILDFAYSYYSKHYYDNRKPVDMMKKLIETANAEELITAFAYNFDSEDNKKYVRMILITKIIYMRLFQDKAANAMFAESNINNNEYVVNVLKHGINIGRIDPAFDTVTFADILIGSIVIMGIKAFSGTAYQVGQLEQEKLIHAILARLLSTALN
jgi:AcrR family transcriptional regulator